MSYTIGKKVILQKKTREMLQILNPAGEIVNKDAIPSLGLSGKDIVKIYELMKATRLLSEQATREAYWNHMTLFIGPLGQEAAEVASAYALRPKDWIFIYGRSWGASIAKGVKAKSVFDGFFGNPNPNSIKDFINHSSSLPYVSVAIQMPHAVGAAWAPQILRNEITPTAAYFGDGGTAEGYFHTALNWSKIFKIPTIFFCENNQYAISTPPHLNTPTKTFAERASGYSMESLRVDGNDIFAVYWAAKRALETALEKSQPTFVELFTYRLGPHTTAVGEICKISEEEKREAAKNDPLVRTKLFLLSAAAKEIFDINWNEKKDLELYDKLDAEIKAAAKTSYEEFLKNHERGAELVAKTLKWHATPKMGERYRGPFESSGQKTFKNVGAREAIGAAIYDAMRFDDSVVYIGEDVGMAGGVMRTTALREDLADEESFIRQSLPDYKEKILRKYLPLKELWPKRVIDTPLDEAGIIGVGLGLSLGDGGKNRARPIMEMQFSGFVRIGLDQIDEFSRITHRYADNLNAPGVILLPFGGGERIEYHRECEIPFFVNNPGLIVACPSRVQDFYDMLRAAVASEKAVLFFAHINLYREPKITELIRDLPATPIENFGIRKALDGEHATVISYGRMVYECLKAAEILKAKEVSVEVLDARILSPLKKEILIESVKKTGRLVTVQEEALNYGVGAEFSAAVAEDKDAFQYLKAPICRVAPPRTHMPPSKFWQYFIPQPEEIARTIMETINYDKL